MMDAKTNLEQQYANRNIEAIWRMESAKLIAALTRMVRDVGLAEDLAQDALVIALERWPQSGIPNNPGAWLMITAKRRAIDLMRRAKLHDRKYEEMAQQTDLYTEEEWEDVLEAGELGDDLLRLIFMTCHPILSQNARVALTLRLLCGLTTDEIARSFLVKRSSIKKKFRKGLLSKLNAPALRSVNIMKRLFPRDRIFGMDIGIDHKGRLWLIEANRFPAMSHFRKLGNKKIIRRIMNFKNSRA